jgi:hypothetical protein
MVVYRVPIVIRGFALVKFPEGKAVGDYMGGLPRDAEVEACCSTPFVCGSAIADFTVELAGQAERVV